jgi:hypothetical protein
VDTVEASPDVDETEELDEPEERDDERTVPELLVELGRDASALAITQAELTASQNMPEVRRAAAGLSAAGLAVLAFLSAFVLANVAAVYGLSTVMSPWLAALVLGAVWLVVGILLAVALSRSRLSRWWRLVTRPEQTTEELEQARDAAAQEVRDTVEELGLAISSGIAIAAVANAGDMASGVLDMGGDVLEATDDIVESITEDVPGGGIVRQMWDVVLMPGRFGLRVVTTVVKRGEPSG